MFIGKKVLRTANDEIVNGEIRSEMERRDKMKEEKGRIDEEVVELEKQINEAIKENKRKYWREQLEKRKEAKDMWGIVRRVKKSKSEQQREGAMLMYEGRGRVTPRAKAEAFVKEYAKVSTLRIGGEQRWAKKEVTKRKRISGPEGEESCDFTWEEVRGALDEMDGGKAAEPDGIHPRLLKMLPKRGIEAYWKLFKESWRSGRVPMEWRKAIIVPLLKQGKEAAQVGSYRPVSLMSCVGKWLERVVANRLRAKLEGESRLSEWQAGFREGRGVGDQLLRLSQEVDDGFQGKKRTVLALFDFSRAYDKVWRDGLLVKLMEKGVGRSAIGWLQGWVAERRACVDIQGVWSKERIFKQGLPQGSVLSPLLFLVFIDDLLERLGKELRVSGFADDLAVWVCDGDVEAGKIKIQWAVDQVWEWSKEWLMVVVIEKCSVSLFSNDPRDTEMGRVKGLKMNGEEIRVEKFPTFLGITYDVKMRFEAQLEKVIKKARKRVGMLRALAGRDWGWSKKLLRSMYLAMVRSVLLFGAPAWTPWLSESGWNKLEAVQREAGRCITGKQGSLPTEGVLMEADLEELKREAEGM